MSVLPIIRSCVRRTLRHPFREPDTASWYRIRTVSGGVIISAEDLTRATIHTVGKRVCSGSRTVDGGRLVYRQRRKRPQPDTDCTGSSRVYLREKLRSVPPVLRPYPGRIPASSLPRRTTPVLCVTTYFSHGSHSVVRLWSSI